MEKYNDIVTALKLSNYPRVMDHLDTGTNKVMAVVIIQSIMKNTTAISTSDKVCFMLTAQFLLFFQDCICNIRTLTPLYFYFFYI